MAEQVTSKISPTQVGTGRSKTNLYTATKVSGPFGSSPEYITEIVKYDNAKGENARTIGTRSTADPGKITWNENASGIDKQNAKKLGKTSANQVKSIQNEVTGNAQEKEALDKASGNNNKAEEGELTNDQKVAKELSNATKDIESVKGTREDDFGFYVFPTTLRAGENGQDFLKFDMMKYEPRNLSMEGRMTVCNMSIEAGAKAGLIAPDETTFEYLKGRTHSPSTDQWEEAIEDWKSLTTDDDAKFDQEIVMNGNEISPHVTWGTNPGQVAPIKGLIPDPEQFAEPAQQESARRALEYMGIAAGTKISEIPVDTVFIGSCTNSRIEDLREAAKVAQGQQVASGVRTLVVPGSGSVKAQAEEEGLHEIFLEAGFDWREPGCSMCLAMNPDKLKEGERCASTSNRNFEGRQGRGG